jgi:AraC family transcriptional regulator
METEAILLDHPARAIAAATAQEPEFLIGTAGAVWSHAPLTTEISGMPNHVLVWHMSGSTMVEKWSDGKPRGTHAPVGSVSLVPAYVASSWVLSGSSQVAHLYVNPADLVAAAAEFERPTTPQLRDFFAEQDPVLAAMLRLAVTQAQLGLWDPLAHEHVMAMIIRHLLLRYNAEAHTTDPAPRAAAPTLPAEATKRLFDYIEAHLDQPLRIADLAAVVYLSEHHFLRAFGLVVGQTPHQYVMARRVNRAMHWLKHSRLDICEIAQRTGFSSPSHLTSTFRSRVGVSPARWRSSTQSGTTAR